MSRQTDFIGALLDPGGAIPDGLTDPEGRPAPRRFAVYRNNVAVSLTEALETGFPVVRKLVGDAFFKAMAGVFLRAHPPASPVLTIYGDALPGFLETFPPVRDLPYLADVARLEWALRCAYHAADIAPMDPAAFEGLSADRVMAARLTVVPAVHLIASPYPVHAIWRANTDPDAPKPGGGAQDVLVTRPDFDPRVDTLGPGAAAFVDRLLHDAPFGPAIAAAEAAEADFDLSSVLGLLLARGAIASLTESQTS